MSHRPIIKKRLARLRKAVNRQPLPAYVDLVEWLKLRRYARTTGEAEKLILAGRVKSDSHRLGVVERTVPRKQSIIDVMHGKPVEYEQREVVERLVPAVRMKNAVVSSA